MRQRLEERIGTGGIKHLKELFRPGIVLARL
jgi:hypothetical protein